MTLQGPDSAGHWGVLMCFPSEGRKECKYCFSSWDGDPWAGRRPLGCAGRAGEVLQWLAELKWASVQGSGPSPWACRSPHSPPCLSSGLRYPALWQLPAAPDRLLASSVTWALMAEGGGTQGNRTGGAQSPPLLQGQPPTAGGCCSELRVLPNQEDRRSGVGPGGVTVGRPGLPPWTPTSAPKDPGAERGTPRCVSAS